VHVIGPRSSAAAEADARPTAGVSAGSVY
jgi:hypothetical protein